jgi:succinyl-CoA synthetase beta subunit
MVASTEGGMAIEEVAEATPEKIVQVAIDPVSGLQPHHIRRVAFALGLQGDQIKQLGKLLAGLYACFTERDASLLEINPLVVTKQGDVVALDGKLSFDDNALFKHKDVLAYDDITQHDPRESEARMHDLNYVGLDGEIGCMVNGAGLAMATMDIIKYHGSAPANFLDVGGGADEEKVTAALKIILADTQVKGILIIIFGGIMKCDTIANGIIAAAKTAKLNVPLVVRLEGTNVDLGNEILKNSGLPIITASDLNDAALKIVDAVKGK